MADKPLPTAPRQQGPLHPTSMTTTPRDELARSLSPLIAVAASQDVEEMCQRNNIPSFADFIKPFGETLEGRVSPRDLKGVPIVIDNFKVRFRAIDKLDEPNHHAVLGLVNDYVRARGSTEPATDFLEIQSSADVNDAYLDAGLDGMMPWYADFRKCIMSHRGITEHETFDHPVAVLIAISSADPDPMSTVMRLYNPTVPSFAVDKPYVDPNMLCFYVILHDPHQTTLEHSQTQFEKMKRSFGLHCHLLKINSRPASQTPEPGSLVADDAIRAIWQHDLTGLLKIQSRLQFHSSNSPVHTRTSSVSSNLSGAQEKSSLDINRPLEDNQGEKTFDFQLTEDSTVPAVQYGCCLEEGDVEATKVMVKELITQSLIPFMERNIQHWNEQVASSRRGFTGRLAGAGRRFFGTSRTPSPQAMQTIPATGYNIPVGTATLTIYPHGAPEAQMRKLADYAFMLRDYKFAYEIYDTVRRDFANEKAYKYHAGTQEMIGICLLMTYQPLSNKMDVDRNFELAVQQYLGRCLSPFHAIRTTVMYYELLKARKMWKEVPTALVRMTGEDSDVRSALFLEQAAHCFLRAPKPMVRKYGFHLMMAGHRYAKASQRQHAYRCYKLSSLILDSHQWTGAKTHVQIALARQAFHLGKLEEAVITFTKILTEANQSVQVAHVREFLIIYRQYASQAGIDPRKESLAQLTLPVIDDQAIRVTLSNAQSNTENEEEWNEMEMELLQASLARGYISSNKKALAMRQQDDHRVTCAVGEPSMVHIELHNPLLISINLSDIILHCQHRESMQRSDEASAPAPSANTPMIEGHLVQGSDDMFDFGAFELQKIANLTLNPLDTITISLAIIPRKTGSINVHGLHYTFNELAHTFRPFHKKGKRLNSTKEQRMSEMYSPDSMLDILVTSPMPLLDIAFHSVPDTVLSGEVIQAVLEINNKGNKGLAALRLKMSHPSFLCLGNPTEMDKNVYPKVDRTSGTDDSETYPWDNSLFDPSVISVPLPTENESNDRGVLNPGMTTLVPLWIRGDRVGRHVFKFLFSYQSEEDNKAIAHRTLRYTASTQVLPSLKINAFSRPSATAVNEYILGVEIENLQTVANFELSQLSLVSPRWTIAPLSINMSSAEDTAAKTTIPARQTTFAYYKIRKLKEPETENTTCPEAWTSNALKQLLSHSGGTSLPPPQINMNISKLAFRDQNIPFDTVPLKPFMLNSRMHWRSSHLQSQFPNIASPQHGDVFTLYNSDDIDLTLYWDIPNMSRHGHHYILGVNLGIVQNPFQGQITRADGRAMFEATAKERAALAHSLSRSKFRDESPIKFLVKSTDCVQHNFEKERLLKVPIAITLKNCSWNKQTYFKLELISWTESKAAQAQKSAKPWQSSHAFHWMGATLFEGKLDPDETYDLQAHCTFQLPGVYDVNRWKLTVRSVHDQEDVFVHWPTLPHLIQVSEA